MATLGRIVIRVNTAGLKEGELKINALGTAIDNALRKAKKVHMPEKLPARAVRMMRNATRALALNIAMNMSLNTPIGDDERIAAGASGDPAHKRYFRLYKERQTKFSIEAKAGYHQGAYKYSNTPVPTFEPEIKTRDQMLKDVKKDFIQDFKIGDTFYIGAQGPAYAAMQGKGIIGDSNIAKDTLREVMLVYKSVMQAAIQQTRISHR